MWESKTQSLSFWNTVGPGAWRNFEDWIRYEWLLMLDWCLGVKGMLFLDEDKISYGAKRELKWNVMLLNLLDTQTIGSEMISEQKIQLGFF